MLSKILSAAMVAAMLTQGCGNSTALTDANQRDSEIGRKPEFFSTSYLFRAGDSNALTIVDRKGKTVQQFTLEPFTHVLTLSLPFDADKQGVLGSGNGEYFISVAETDYAIIKKDGSVSKNPVGLAGQISSAAFDPVHHYLLIADEFKSMAIMALSPSGDIVGSWTAGSLFPGDKLIGAGTMLDDGRLVLSVGETSLAIIDLGASIAAQAWQYTSFDVLDSKSMAWLASVPNQPNVVMVYDQNSDLVKNRYLAIDLQSMTILDQEDVTGKQVFGEFRDYTPHAIFRGDADGLDGARIIYVGDDGKFVRKPLSYGGKQITQTWLDPVSTTLTIAFDPSREYDPSFEDPFYFEAQDIYRVRLSDNFVDITKVEEQSAMAITPSYLFLLFPSALGKAERLTYGKTP